MALATSRADVGGDGGAHLALARPSQGNAIDLQLAKDLNPVELSRTLQSGLRPLDNALIIEAARSFADMESVANTLQGLVAADEAPSSFLAIDATLEGFELAGEGSQAFGGAALVLIGAVVAFLALTGSGGGLKGRRNGAEGGKKEEA